LYTSYLQVLGRLHEPSAHATKRLYPPPPVAATFAAGFTAGTIQSLAAAPLDALQVRFHTSDMLEGHYKSMWEYGLYKLNDIGVKGVFSGWTLSFLKDSFGYGVFFATFEYVKQQSYYAFLTRYYGSLHPEARIRRYESSSIDEDAPPIIRPHYTVEPAFIFMAGIAASVAQQLVQHPLTLIQNIHYERLESLDYITKLEHTRTSMLKHYYDAYEKTFEQCARQAIRAGGWRRWLYKNFFFHTIRQVPSTSAGLLVFEVVRRKYGKEAEATKIEKDGYDILLT